MTTVTTYTSARQALAELCDQVSATREPVVIRRRRKADVALIAADELASLMETAHLMRSPKNARRLLGALSRAQTRELPPSSLEGLQERLGVGQDAR